MSDTPQIPQMGQKKGAGRPSKAALDERAAGLDMREGELAEREAALARREEELGKLPPRVSIDEGAAPKEFTPHAQNTKAIRTDIGVGKKFPDPTPYMQKYQDKKFLWVNDIDGEVQRWIDAGAEPVPVLVNERRQFEGLTDRHESKWVRVVGGETQSGAFYVYMLMMDPEIYDRVKLAPVRQRQANIRQAIEKGRDQSNYGDGPQLPTYAPELPSGGTGLDQHHEVAQ